MTRFLALVLLAAMTTAGTQALSAPESSDSTGIVTFNKDVLPILQNNCQSCHRPAAIAPMSFMTYDTARPWAKAMKSAVLGGKMPPWLADPHVGEFRNAPKLTEADVRKLVAWADTGATEGDAADKPAAIQWVEGWRTQPDVIVAMPTAYRVPAKGSGEIKEVFLPNPFTEDTWVSSIEIRPGDPSVVHHVILQIPDLNARSTLSMELLTQLAGAPGLQAIQQRVGATGGRPEVILELRPDGVPRDVTRSTGYASDFARRMEERTGRGTFMTMEAVYAPGAPPIDYQFTDAAKLIPGGMPIRLEIHYTPNGKETLDATRVGFTLAKASASRQFVIMAPEHMVDERKSIPAGAENWETRGEITFNQNADLVWFMPHMHLRGKDMTYRLIRPDGREETVLSAKFNFNWQLGYETAQPIKVTPGTRMIITAHHDNSTNNPSNPSGKSSVKWGEMTSEEMMLPWFGVVADRGLTPDQIATYRPPNIEAQGKRSGAFAIVD